MLVRAPSTPSPQDLRAQRLVLAVLAAYALGFAAFWPSGILVSDEAGYVGSAWAFAHGRTTTLVRDGLTGLFHRELPGLYPPGTAALQAPFVALFGFRGAPLASLLCWLATGLLLASWLRRTGRSPFFALLFLGFLPALVLGRVAMSDLPSALLVAACQWLVFTGEGSAGLSFLAGLLGGASLLFRETNALFVGPLLAGAVLRREGRTLPLCAGALAGVALRLLGSYAAFGDPLFSKDHGYGWSLSWAVSHLPLYLGALLVLAPLGLFGALAYRGPRRPEVIATTLTAFAFFVAYGYSGEESGFLKQLVLGPRYFIPLVPLLAVALAEALPRWWSARGRPGGERLETWLGTGWALCVLAAALAVHPVLGRYARGQRELAEALVAATSPQGVVVLDLPVTAKYLAEWDGPRSILDLGVTPPEALPGLVARDGVAFLALLDRSDSAFHRDHAVLAERWREAASARCALETAHDGVHGGLRLRVFRVERCR